MRRIFTIGHSTHAIKDFIELLSRHSISVVADVRSSPRSQFNPQFNRQELKKSLGVMGIKYVFLGKELGARSTNPECYQNGKVIYSRLAETDLFKEGIERLLNGAGDHRITLMCAEKEPLDCHRTILVAQALTEKKIAVSHIHANGTLETHAAALERLLDIVGLTKEDMFKTKEDLISEALTLQEDRIAYVNNSQGNIATRAI